jgi:uncharacterized protein YciI
MTTAQAAIRVGRAATARAAAVTGVLAVCAAAGLGGAWAQSTAQSPPPPSTRLFAIEVRTGPAWDASKPPQEQSFFREHSAHLRALREQGRIVAGARYGDKGLVVLSVASEAEARALMQQDPSMRHGTFAFELNAMNVFYPGMLVAPPRVAAPGSAAASASADAGSIGVASLSWLAGCWAHEGREAGSVEQWMTPAGGAMLGMSRTVRGGRVVEHEFMQIRTGEAGRIAYVAAPSGQRETSFVLVQQAADAVTFENPTHDFPQRVIYRALPEGRLAARIEGLRNGTPRGIDFPMRRVPCDGPAAGPR